MGSACCVAAKDRTVTNGSRSEILQSNVRYSPSWSFRWDNRGRVAGEETSMNLISHGVNRNVGLDIKSRTTPETAYASEEGSPLDSFRTLTWQKSPTSEGNAGVVRLPPPDPSVSTNSMEVKESTESPAVSLPSPAKMSPSMHSISSLSTSHLSSQCHLLPPSSAPSRGARRSPGPGNHLLRQVSDCRIPGFKSSNFSISEEGSSFGLLGWSNESMRSSHGGSSDGGSTPAFSDFMTTSHRESWSFDSENRDRISRMSGRISSSPSIDIQSCGVCSKLLTEKSTWGSQKIIATNELAVVAVLICGHVYHAECLESMTPEISKYDPACPVCTFGEKQAVRLSEKALRAEMGLKVKNNKRSRKRVVDGVLNGDSLGFGRQKSSGHESRGLKMSSSSSMKSSSGKPFLRRHFSFGSMGSRSLSANHSTRKKGFFWTKSSKE